METKLFEVRDRGTFIPVICTCLRPSNEADRYILGRTGFGLEPNVQASYVLYASLEEDKIHYDPVYWDNRTRQCSHDYIRDHWDDLKSGEVIDVEFILGETDEKKESEAARRC